MLWYYAESMDFKLGEKRKEHFMGGGKEKQEQQRKKGKLIVFERMNALFDSGSFVEIDPFVIHDCVEFIIKNGWNFRVQDSITNMLAIINLQAIKLIKLLKEYSYNKHAGLSIVFSNQTN